MFKKKAFFIVFEGVEGCGKSFQSKKLFNNLRRKKISTLLTREPGGTKSAELIRDLILKDYFKNSKKEKFDKYTDTLLYLAARNEHVISKIKPALKQNKVVICDRFTDSTLAYQVYGKKVNLGFINIIHKYILGSLKPNLTFILKVTPKSSRKRLLKRKTKNRYDNFSKSFYNNVQKYFLRLSKNKRNYYVLNSSKDDNTLEKEILKITCKYLKLK